MEQTELNKKLVEAINNIEMDTDAGGDFRIGGLDKFIQEVADICEEILLKEIAENKK